MSIKDECAQAGKKMAAKLKLLGETICIGMTNEQKSAFWSAVRDELTDVFDDIKPENTTRH